MKITLVKLKNSSISITTVEAYQFKYFKRKYYKGI